MKWVVVGLGNPGGAYAHTRHNAGRDAVAVFVDRIAAEPWKKHAHAKARVAVGAIEDTEVVCVLPETYMNVSGSAVAAFVPPAGGAAAAERLILVYDDIDLPVGTIRISFGRGTGGHKGVASVAQALQTRDFVRVRIGVAERGEHGAAARPGGALAEYVLSAFRSSERDELADVYERAADAIAGVITDGRERAMNTYNAAPDGK